MSTQSDPKGLGKIVVPNSGTPVPVTSSGFIVRVVSFQADPLNVGTYMLLKDAAGNLMARWSKGQSYTPPMLPSAGVDLSSLQLDTDTNGDGAIVSYV